MTGKVLIVDDESGIREIVKNIVEYGGHIASTTTNGLEALERVKAENFDIVISDIQMPQMDGLALAEEIHKVQPDTIVILMTGYASLNSAIEAIKRDVFDYILKPFQNINMILQTIERGLDRKHMLQERKALVDDLRRTNDELTYNRVLLDEKIKKIDSELSRRIRRLTTLYDISRSISSIKDIPVLLRNILESISNALNSAVGTIWLVDQDSRLLKKAATIGLKNEALLPDSFFISEGELGATVSTGILRVFKSADELSDPVFKKVCAEEDLSTIVMIPLVYEKQILGVVNVMFRDSYAVIDDDISLLKAIADQASVSVKNAELFYSQQYMFHETIEALATAIDSRDHYTGGHSFLVTQYALTIARRMGLDKENIDLIEIAGLLHDIGKIGISDSILNKPGRLTDEEMGVIKAHPILGRTIIESIASLKHVAPIIYFHHEHYDGSGYPEGRKGKDIPLLSRILTVADIFHALTSDRIYRIAMEFDKALSVMQAEMGVIMDPGVGKVFFSLVKEGEILPPLQQMINRPALGNEYV